MRKLRNFMLEYLGRPGSALIALGIAVALVIAGTLLGEKALIGVCVLLGLFVVAMVLSLVSILYDNYKEKETRQQIC